MKHSSTATKKSQGMKLSMDIKQAQTKINEPFMFSWANKLHQYSIHAVNKTPGFSHENEILELKF